MSYRELRNFTEMLRTLGYPRLVSMENFRSPNFKLVAEILAWLLKRYDADLELSLALDTEQDRVIFIKTAALFLVQKARIKVNPKKLYQADGYAVQEMLKVAGVLYEATKNDYADTTAGESSANLSTIRNEINTKLSSLRSARQLAAEMPEKGASLYDLLSKEVDLREQRSGALARPLELSVVEKSIRSSIRAVEEETKQTVQNLNNISSDEATLDAKIEKRRADLERQQKRLAQLQAMRPAYMDEFEKLEDQLKALYSVYVQKFRILSHLEQAQVEYDRAEQERHMEAEMSLRRMAERMREEERVRLAAAERLDAMALDGEQEPLSESNDNKGPKVYGNMTGAGLSDEDDDDSLLSDDDEPDSEMLNQAAVSPRPCATVTRTDAQPVRERPPIGDARGGKAAATTDDDGLLNDSMDDENDLAPPQPPAPTTVGHHRASAADADAADSDDDF